MDGLLFLEKLETHLVQRLLSALALTPQQRLHYLSLVQPLLEEAQPPSGA